MKLHFSPIFGIYKNIGPGVCHLNHMLGYDDPPPSLWFSTITFICYLIIDETVMDQFLGYIINTLRFYSLCFSLI